MTTDGSQMTGEGIVLYIMSVTGIVANGFAVLRLSQAFEDAAT